MSLTSWHNCREILGIVLSEVPFSSIFSKNTSPTHTHTVTCTHAHLQLQCYTLLHWQCLKSFQFSELICHNPALLHTPRHVMKSKLNIHDVQMYGRCTLWNSRCSSKEIQYALNSPKQIRPLLGCHMKSTLRSLCPKLCQLHLEGWFQNITSEWLAYKLGNLWMLHPARNYLGLKSPGMYEGESHENLKNNTHLY